MFNFRKKKDYKKMTSEQLNAEIKKREEKDKIENEKRRIERVNFLENLLKRVKNDFEEYEKGYRVTSMKIEDNFYNPDTKTLSDITNMITDRYNCKLHSFSVSENSVSGRTYFFMFEK